MQDFATSKASAWGGALNQLHCFNLKHRFAVRAMKLTSILLMVGCLQLSARGLTQTVSISVKDAPLLTVLKAIEKQTGFVFFLNNEQLQKAKKVTINAHNVPLQQVLDLCFKEQPLTYEISGKVINVYPKGEKKSIESVTTGTEQMAREDVVDITGRVTNEFGEPLSGANVVIKRTGLGTITNANGQFALKNLNNDDILRISFVGYTPLIIPVNGRSNFTLVMNLATNSLDAAVVQAYGKTTDRLRTGNIGRITSEDIEKRPVINVLQALQGQVPGTIVTHSSGYSSSPIKVEIRGRNTISDYPSDPMYIIDGVPLTILDLQNRDTYANGSQGVIQSGIQSPAGGQSPLFSINPNDIESIEVLKDADATAIYGSRASNGVILITTKKGKAGRTKVNVNMYTGVAQLNKRYDLLSTQQYVEMRKEALANDGFPLNISTAPDLVVWDTTKYTDWQNYLFDNTGSFTSTQATLSGGDARTSFRLSGSYNYAKDIFAASGSNKRGSFSFNIKHNSLNQRLKMGFSANYSLAKTNTISIPGSITLYPNAPDIFDNLGNLNYSGWSPMANEYPFFTLLQPYIAKTNFLNSNLNLSYEIIKGLNATINFGYNNFQNSQDVTIPIASRNPSTNPVGEKNLGYSFSHNIIIEPQLDYNTFIGKGKLNILVGGSTQQNETSSAVLNGTGYAKDALLSSIAFAPTQSAGNYGGNYKYTAAFSRINYNWEDKYIVNINGRRDGSTKFGPGNQFGNFGSIGAAWIFTESQWIKKHLPFLSFGKLRGSYGITGGDQIANYQYLSRWQYYRFTYNNILPLAPLGHTDSLLHWQVNHKTEFALNLGFLQNKISLEVVWYQARCDNQLVQFPTPMFSGFGSVSSNSPANVQNKGWEFILNTNIITNKNFSWTFKFNLGMNKNKLLGYPNLSESPFRDRYIVGQPLGITKVLHVIGVDPQTGLYTFEDRNNDGQITIDQSGKNNDDRYALDLSTKFDGGITNNIAYKNFEVSVFCYFKRQHRGISAKASFLPAGTAGYNQGTYVLDRWRKPGDITNVPRFTSQTLSIQSFAYFRYSDGIYTDASFIRLQNLSLSYKLPDKIARKLKTEGFKIYVEGENIFVLTKYDGIDPEVQLFGSPPLPRIITAGITCNF